MKKKSGAIELLDVLWAHRQEGTSHSWLKLNHAMREGLMLAVKMGINFEIGDIHRMFEKYRAGYWIGDLESFYQHAVLYRHTSAWQCFEEHAARKPFIWADARMQANRGDGPIGNGLARLVVGAEFKWEGEKVTVTSFNDEAHNLTACSYTRDPGQECDRCSGWIKYPESKLLHRHTITHELLAQAKKAMREAKKPKPAEVA